MKRLIAAVAAVAALALSPAPAAAKAAAKAPVTRDWSRLVAATPQGGFRMGNPAAPVKLVEYGSLSCPHCRHFAETGYRPLVQQYVRTGRVSYEFRTFLLNGPDISVTLLAHCAGAARFFPMAAAVFAAQPDWQGKFAALSDDDKAALDRLTNEQRVVRFAEIGGLPAIAARFGVTPAQARQCLTDRKRLKMVLDMTQKAIDAGIEHTPTFLINGAAVSAATWEDLEPLLRRPGGRT